MIAGKIWGSTAVAYQSAFLDVRRLVIKPNHQCSLHQHKRKNNGFIVVSGKLFIDVVKNEYALTDTTELKPGEMTVVMAGEHHRFRTGDEPCVAFEFYEPAAMTDDIERQDTGGPVPADNVRKPVVLG